MFTVPQHCLLWESCTQGNYNLNSHLRGARWERLRVGWASPGHLCEVGALYFLLLSFNARNRKPCQDKLHLKNKTNKKTRMYWFISLEPRARTDLIRKPNRAQEVISVVLLPSLHILDVGSNFRCILTMVSQDGCQQVLGCVLHSLGLSRKGKIYMLSFLSKILLVHFDSIVPT